MSSILMKCGCRAQAVYQAAPICVVHMCKDIEQNIPDFSDRKSKCGYCNNIQPSDISLPFFEYKGPGCEQSESICKNCGYHRIAHKGQPGSDKHLATLVNKEGVNCSRFEEHGPWEFDSFYCGCRGWD